MDLEAWETISELTPACFDKPRRQWEEIGLLDSAVSVERPGAVKTFDHLAALDVTNMRSLSDHPMRINGRIQRLREVMLSDKAR